MLRLDDCLTLHPAIEITAISYFNYQSNLQSSRGPGGDNGFGDLLSMSSDPKLLCLHSQMTRRYVLD